MEKIRKMALKWAMSYKGLWVVAVCAGVPLAVPWAQPPANELFAATEVTAAPTSQPQQAAQAASEIWFSEAPSSPLNVFAVEPAAGHEPASTEGEKGGEGGEGEPKKAKSGKELTKPPELPKVMVGGVEIMTQEAMIAKETSASVPDVLKRPIYNDVLTIRMYINTYAHAPMKGDAKAPIKVIEFADLSCSKCLDDLKKIDEDLKPYVSQTAIIHVHAPSVIAQGTNMAAFYGKIAERSGKFWEFRDQVIAKKPATVDDILAILVGLGITETQARNLLLNESRRFYRELDADALEARSYGTGQTPGVFVNGIRVGGEGIPLDKLPDVMDYVTNRLKHGLPEPPR